MCTIAINGEDPIAPQGALEEINHHQTTHEKYKVNISLCRRKKYQRTYIEEVHSIYYQVRTVVSHLEVRLPEKKTTPNNIGEDL